VIMVPSAPQSHAERQWHIMPGLYQGMAERFHTVWYDSRGTGLSERKATDFSRGAMVRDLDAIVERVGEARFALLGWYDAVPIAATYAAAHPERVTHLVLVDGRVKTTDYFEAATIDAERALRDLDWTLYTETLARVLIGLDDADYAARFAEHLRACVEPEALRKAFADQTKAEFDVPDGLLETITAPTLVVHNRKNNFLPIQSGQRIAAAIPDARLLIFDDMKYESLPTIIADFIGVEGLPSKAPPPALAGTAVILFADIVESTALTERLGDDAFRERARQLDEAMRAAIRSNGGTAVEGKTLGDGVLAVFTSAKQAIGCARACHDAAGASGLALHAGIHAGDVIREADNVYGGAVNIAARVAAASAAGETLVSGTVRELARTSAGVVFEDRGEQLLKGIDDPVRVWAVRQA